MEVLVDKAENLYLDEAIEMHSIEKELQDVLDSLKQFHVKVVGFMNKYYGEDSDEESLYEDGLDEEDYSGPGLFDEESFPPPPPLVRQRAVGVSEVGYVKS